MATEVCEREDDHDSHVQPRADGTSYFCPGFYNKAYRAGLLGMRKTLLREDFTTEVGWSDYCRGYTDGIKEYINTKTMSLNAARKAMGIPEKSAPEQGEHLNGEIRTTSSTGGQKGVKPERYSLIPTEALDIMARLYGFGAEKYAAHNWRKGYEWSKSFDSLFRHATAALRGEDIDPETGLPHLAGAAFHCFTLMVFMEEHPEFDDRYKPDSLTEDLPPFPTEPSTGPYYPD